MSERGQFDGYLSAAAAAHFETATWETEDGSLVELDWVVPAGQEPGISDAVFVARVRRCVKGRAAAAPSRESTEDVLEALEIIRSAAARSPGAGVN